MKELEQDRAASPSEEENRNRYETPRLVQYGDIHSITSFAISGPNLDIDGFRP